MKQELLERVRKILYNNREVLIIDYSDCRGDKLVQILDEAVSLVLDEKKSYVILSIFNNKAYASPQLMRRLENVLSKVEPYIEKQAIVGISSVQEWIIKGVNLWANPRIHVFKSMEEALDFLVDR